MGDDKVPGFRPDIPQGNAIVLKTKEEAARLARRIAGEALPDECRFSCIQCGWDKTLRFDKEEIEILGDVRNYVGPCGQCGLEMLRPFDSLGGDEFRPIAQRAKENRRAEYNEAADVFIDKAGERIGAIMGGMVPNSILDPVQDQKHAVPGKRDDLPDAGDVDMSDLPPRKG